MASELTASFQQIPPNFSSTEGYELSGVSQEIVPNSNISAYFNPTEDLVEFWVYDANNNLLSGDENFTGYTFLTSPPPQNETTTPANNTNQLELSPVQDVNNLGFTDGILKVAYNFISYRLGTNPTQSYYLSEISSDRTEVRLASNFIPPTTIKSGYAAFVAEMQSVVYDGATPAIDEFYLNFGDNKYQIGVNSQIDTSVTGSPTILVKLFDALPSEFSLKDTLSVVVKPAESVAYQITNPPIIISNSDIDLSNVTYLKGPNTTLEINNFLNNSTDLVSQNDILNTNSTSSADNLSNILNQKGISLTPNYSYDTFNEFVNFSSAKRRIENFIEKVTQIQAYEADITTLSVASSTPQVSSSIATAADNINTLIKNFDGYEYFLYYSSGSSSYPKTGSYQPYGLLPTTDVSVSVWLGSDVENSQYYGGISLSASFFDNTNQNWLYYTIPEFIRDNSENNQYLEFSNMVGQHFDEVWLYTRAVTEKLNTTSQLTDGVPLDLADDVIASLGYDGFGSNFNNQDPYIGLLGENNGTYVPPTGSELITNYIAVNNGEVVNYWNPDYSFENYVEQLNDPGYPYAIDKVSKEIFKRLYHNMSYLVKKKGTVSGLRQLINIWGIPNTILRINEFGGKNKDNTDDYDLWFNRYSYAFSPISTQNVASASVVFPWMPLERNRIADSKYIVPDNLQFRFKTTGYPSSSQAGEFFTQSLAVKKSDGDNTSTDFDFGISLFYEPVATGSYSGSYSSEYEDWGKMRFYISGAAADGGVATSNDIYLPFYDKGWWAVMLQRNQHVSASVNTVDTTYTLYAKNSIYNGADGNSIGFEGSASISSSVVGVASQSLNEAWNKFGVASADGIYLGGFVSGSTVGGITTGLSSKIFSGSLQEFRYYSNDIPEGKFNDFVMNPESIEGNSITGSESSFDIVNFRAPLGNELENVFTSSLSSSYSDPLISMHPAIQGNADILITGSFVNPTGNVTSSTYNVLYYQNSTTKTYSKTNTEVYFLDQPAIGFRNRISNKIQVRDGDDYGTILSNRISIQQDYQISQSYTENINNLEVAFSPQDEVNDDIIASFGYGVVADAIADPRFLTSSDSFYPQLRKIAEDYFKKYTEGNAYDYLRLIGYFDNSIFKAIKAYVPARTSVSTGIVIKQTMLERNRVRPVQISEGTTIALTPSGGMNTPIIMENIELTGSIDIGNIEGGTGGALTQYNYVGNQFTQSSGLNQGTPASASFLQTPISQSWVEIIPTIAGTGSFIRNEQDEFYDGEFSGSEFIATDQDAFPNPYLRAPIAPINYYTQVHNTQSLSQSVNFLTQTIGTDTTILPSSQSYFANGHTYGVSTQILIVTGSLGEKNLNTNKVWNSFEDFQNDSYSASSGAPASESIANFEAGVFPFTETPIVVWLWKDPIIYVSSSIDPWYNQDFYVAKVGIPSNVKSGYGEADLLKYINNNVVEGIYQNLGTPDNTTLENPLPKGTYPYFNYTYNPFTPYLRLELSSSFTTTGITPSASSQIYDDNLGGAPWTVIDSSALGKRTNTYLAEVPIIFGSPVRTLGTSPNMLYQTFGSDDDYDLGRPIRTQAQYASTVYSTEGFPSFAQFDRTGAGYPTSNTQSYFDWIADGTFADPTAFPAQDWTGKGTWFYSSSMATITTATYEQWNGQDGTLTLLTGKYSWASTTSPGTYESWIATGLAVGSNANLSWSLYNAAIPDPADHINYPDWTNQGDTSTFLFNYPQLTSSFAYNSANTSSAVPGILPIDPADGTPVGTTTGSFQFILNNYYTAQQSALTDFQTNPVTTGTASLYTFPVNWTNSFGNTPTSSDRILNISASSDGRIYFSGSGQTSTTAFSINNVSIDTTDPTQGINNETSFQQHPSINFNLNYSGALTPTSQSNTIFTNQLISSSIPILPKTSTNFLYSPLGRKNQGEPGFILQTKYTQYNIDPYILDTGIGLFENTQYYATPNNYNENRPNTERYVVENQFGINTISNLPQIADGLATKAQTPNSNYTSKKIILPRYLGSKVTSANYNTYSPDTSILPRWVDLSTLPTVEFANGTTGSWVGDSSLGKVAAIDKNPIYFAHFESSYDNYELDGTYTFNIDQLIVSPFNDITELVTLPNATTIEVKGGTTQSLTSVSSVFEKNRKATVIYNRSTIDNIVGEPTQSGAVWSMKSSSVIINYNTITPIGPRTIFQGSLEYKAIATSNPNPHEFSTNTSMSFFTPNKADASTVIEPNFPPYTTTATSGISNNGEFISYLQTESLDATPSIIYGSSHWAETGSGYIDLLGGGAVLDTLIAVKYDPTVEVSIVKYFGPSLALMHSYNYWLKNGLTTKTYDFDSIVTSSFNQPGLPLLGEDQNWPTDPENKNNYFRFNTSASQAGASALGYTDFDVPFLIEREDEISVTYDLSGTNSTSQTPTITQDFRVMDISDKGNGYFPDVMLFTTESSGTPPNTSFGVSGSSIFNRIHVTPDPSTLTTPISGGVIDNFTIRRRIDAENKVIIYQSNPVGSFGSQTLSGDGYLIPEDMTAIQKANINTVIRSLTAPPSTNDQADVSGIGINPG